VNKQAESAGRDLFRSIGERSLGVFSYIGETVTLYFKICIGVVALPWGRWLMQLAMPWAWPKLSKDRKWQSIIDQMKTVGIDSFPLVFLVALFTGMVLALQSAYQLQQIGAETFIGSLVALSMVRELGPVLTALVVAGRVGASITAEVGTMQVTEQIDALETLATDPIRYLAVPRLIALFVMLPILTVYADVIGILGGYTIGVYKLGIGSTLYMNSTWDPLALKDIFTGLFKAAVFGSAIATVACYEGFATKGGAEGVGRYTTLSVVISFIMIIASDCFFTALFYFVFP